MRYCLNHTYSAGKGRTGDKKIHESCIECTMSLEKDLAKFTRKTLIICTVTFLTMILIVAITMGIMFSRH